MREIGTHSSRNRPAPTRDLPRITLVAAALLVAVLVLSGQVAVAGSLEQEALTRINQERKAAGLAILKFDERLQAVALSHAEEMVELGYFSHVSPVTGTPSSRLRREGVEFTKMGENVGRHSSLAVIHQALMRSPSHRGAILHPAYDRVGIGVVRQGDGRLLMVQVFMQSPQTQTYVAGD